jgi:hypothetical protein
MRKTSYDDPVHAPLGLRAARIYSKIAPEAGHAQHMTSHIFLALGMWDDEVKANETAMAVVNKGRQKAGKPPAMCGHYNEWLEYGYLQQGRVADARRVLEGCRQAAEKAAAAPVAQNPAHGGMTMSGMSPAMAAVGSYTEMRAHFLICTQLWNDEVVRWTMPPGDYTFPQLTFDYTNAIAAIRRGDTAGGREAVSRAETDKPHIEAWMKEQKMDAPEMTETLLIAVEQLRAMLTAAEGKPQDAVQELKRISAKEHQLPLEFGPPNIEKPSDELLGEVLLQLNRPSEARDAFQAALARTPGRRLVLEELARTEKEMAAKKGEKPAATNTPVHNH